MTYSNPTIDQITNLYLFGQDTTPDKATEAMIRPTPTTSVDLDGSDFMTTGAGRFATGAQFEVVQDFFTQTLSPGSYTQDQLNTLFGLTGNDLRIQQYNYADGTDDYAARVWIYNSSHFEIYSGAEFVVHANGTKEILNFAVLPKTDNFDFDSDNWLANLSAAYTEPRVDPSHIGGQVTMTFSNLPSVSTYDATSYAADQTLQSSWDPLPLLHLTALPGVLDDLFTDGVTDFTKNGFAIRYGTGASDIILTNDLKDHPYLGDAADAGQIVYAGGGDDDIRIGSAGLDFEVCGGAGTDIVQDYRTSGVGVAITTHDVEHIIGSEVDEVFKIDGAVTLLDGNGGTDTLDLTAFTSGVTASFGGGEQTVSGIQVIDVEEVRGTAFDDAFTNLDNSVVLRGEGGDDTLTGSSQADTVLGGEGNDSIAGGDGDDHLTADAGSDTLYGGDGADTLTKSSAGETDQSEFHGEAGNDLLAGTVNGWGVFLDGGDGDDTLYAGSGFDFLLGGEGNDVLNITAGATAYGEGGDDTYNLALGVGLAPSGFLPVIWDYNGGSNHLQIDGANVTEFNFNDAEPLRTATTSFGHEDYLFANTDAGYVVGIYVDYYDDTGQITTTLSFVPQSALAAYQDMNDPAWQDVGAFRATAVSEVQISGLWSDFGISVDYWYEGGIYTGPDAAGWP